MKKLKPAIFTFLLAVFVYAGIETGFAQTVSNPVYNSYTQSASWSHVYFGMYPQREVTEYDYLTSAVKIANYNVNGDAIVEGHKFRRVTSKDGANRESYRYYLYEPISWKVLQVENGTLLLMSDQILDSQMYGCRDDEEIQWSWSGSALRSWLNGYTDNMNLARKDYSLKGQNFISMAFTESEQNLLLPVGKSVDGQQMTDKCSLLTEDEAGNERYGFPSTDYYDTSVTRVFNSTDYADREQRTDEWWLSTLYGYCDSEGEVLMYDETNRYKGVCPQIKISENSSLWSIEKPQITVTGKSLSQCTVSGINQSGYTYDGQEKKPSVTVKDGRETLREGVDYTVSYADNINAGNATVMLAGCGDYVGTKWVSFPILKAEQTLSASSFTKQYGEKTFNLNVIHSKGDGAVTYITDDAEVAMVDQEGNVTPRGIGETTITIRASETENYHESTIRIEVTIEPRDISECDITLSEKSYIYNGKERTPEVLIEDGEELEEGVDYTMYYEDNVDAGTAYVSIEGRGNYCGSEIMKFTIKKCEQKLSASNVKKSYGDKKFKLKVVQKKGNGKLKYSSENKKVATIDQNGNVKITGCGETKITIVASETKNYKKAEKTISITVYPKKVQIKNVKSEKRGEIEVTWKADPTVSGYVIQCVLGNKKYASEMNKGTYSGVILVNAKPGKTYKVSVCAYKTVGGKRIYGSFSSSKTVTVRKK